MFKRTFFFLCLLLFSRHAIANKTPCEQIEDKNLYVIAVLVDVSDPLDAPDRLAFEKLSKMIVSDSSSEFIRVDLYKIASNAEDITKPLLSICKPFSSGRTFSTGAKFLDRRIKKDFQQPLLTELGKLSSQPNIGSSSPIIENIYSIALKSFVNDKGDQLKGRLVVVSDFMQNSTNLSFYKKTTSYSEFKTSISGNKWIRHFGNVSVRAVVIPRDGPNKLPVFGRDFFIKYFDENFYGNVEWKLLSSI